MCLRETSTTKVSELLSISPFEMGASKRLAPVELNTWRDLGFTFKDFHLLMSLHTLKEVV